MTKITSTRRTVFGFGYTVSCEQTEHGLVVRDVTVNNICHIGTIRQVSDAIDNDMDLASFRSGGTYYNSSWFVKVAGKWMKISGEYERSLQNDPMRLLEKRPGRYPGEGEQYDAKSIELEVI
jgi:hypothetical protein